MRTRTLPLATVFALAALLAPWTASAQSELQSRHFLTSDSVELHYLEAGSGPPLVFVPGWTMPAWIWEHQLEHFLSTHRVVALDPRGQGRSEKPSHGYHATRRARDVCELLEHLGGEPAVVAGWSLAVQEVMVCADEFGTEHIRAVVLVDFFVDLDEQASRPIADDRIEALQVEREAWTREFVRGFYRTDQPEEYLESVTRASLATPTNAAAVMIANYHFVGPRDLRPALEALDRPLLFVASSQPWAVEAASTVREHRPAARVEILEGTRHALFADRPEEFNRVLEEFLATLPAR